MDIFDLGRSASHCDTEIAHAMLLAVAWAIAKGAKWW